MKRQRKGTGANRYPRLTGPMPSFCEIMEVSPSERKATINANRKALSSIHLTVAAALKASGLTFTDLVAYDFHEGGDDGQPEG